MSTNENLEHSTTYENHDSLDFDFSDDKGTDLKHELTEEEVRHVLEDIVATGQFWHDWDKLMSMLSFYIKKVLSAYPEVKMNAEEQHFSLGETYMELVTMLDDALHSFLEGPPFTLQRLCEILLAAQEIYPKLSKLALALEKNLLVTSTLTKSTDPPYVSATTHKPSTLERGTEDKYLQSNGVEVEQRITCRDEVMVEVEGPDVGDSMTIGMETFEEISNLPETNSKQSSS